MDYRFFCVVAQIMQRNRAESGLHCHATLSLVAFYEENNLILKAPSTTKAECMNTIDSVEMTHI